MSRYDGKWSEKNWQPSIPEYMVVLKSLTSPHLPNFNFFLLLLSVVKKPCKIHISKILTPLYI